MRTIVSKIKKQVFSTEKKMIDFVSQNDYYNAVTYYDPSKGWVVNCYERTSDNGNCFQDCGNDTVLCTG